MHALDNPWVQCHGGKASAQSRTGILRTGFANSGAIPVVRSDQARRHATPTLKRRFITAPMIRPPPGVLCQTWPWRAPWVRRVGAAWVVRGS